MTYIPRADAPEQLPAAPNVTHAAPVENRRGDFMTEHSLWELEGGQSAQCQDCGWQIDARASSARVSAFVDEHVEEFGHEVHTTRQQVRKTRPAGWRQMGRWEPERGPSSAFRRERKAVIARKQMQRQGALLATGRPITWRAAGSGPENHDGRSTT